MIAFWKKRGPQLTREDSLAAVVVPNRQLRVERNAEGVVTLYAPFHAAAFVERIARWLGAPARAGEAKVELDEVWLLRLGPVRRPEDCPRDGRLPRRQVQTQSQGSRSLPYRLPPQPRRTQPRRHRHPQAEGARRRETPRVARASCRLELKNARVPAIILMEFLGIRQMLGWDTMGSLTATTTLARRRRRQRTPVQDLHRPAAHLRSAAEGLRLRTPLPLRPRQRLQTARNLTKPAPRS